MKLKKCLNKKKELGSCVLVSGRYCWAILDLKN